MADLSFYKYLEAAFRHKLYKDTTATSFKYLDYSLPYESISGKKGIFEYARKILPKFYTSEFPDTKEGNLAMAKKVLEKLERKQDTELVKQFEGFNAAEDEQTIEEAKTQSETAAQPAAVGEPAATMAGGGHMPSLPSTPSIRFTSPNPRGELRSGMEGGTGEGTAATNKSLPRDSSRLNRDSSGVHIRDKLVSQQGSLGSSIQRPRIPGSFVNAFKNFGSKLGVFFKRNFGKFLTVGRIATGVGAVIGGFAGAGLTGGASMGVLGGSIGGAILPSWVRSSGAGRFFGRAGNGVINFGARLSNQVGKGGLKLAGPKKKVALLLLGSFLLFGLAAGLLGALNPGGTPTGTSPVAGTLPSDISQCKFEREGDGASHKISYRSPLLLTYIQEASRLTKIPPAVLAAFIRVESPSAVNFSDDQVKSYQCIFSDPGRNVSASGALGIMQIQPQGSKSTEGQPASCDDCIDAGAKLIGKTVATITTQDYCDPRTSVIVGAGWILKKMTKPTQYSSKTYGDGTKWDDAWTNDREAINKMVDGYYGCLKYPSCTSGPYNYGGDVWNSIQNCKITTATASTRVQVTKDGPKIAREGEEITYQITVTNNEAGKVNVKLSDSLVSEVEFKSASDGGVFERGIVKWDLKDVTPSSTKILTLTVVVKPLPSGVSEINITNPKVGFDKY